jgi:uncharacterized protein YecE (DUF72 family)
MGCDIRIGTSGFHYKHWKGPFYPEKCPAAKMLDYYVQRFDTVELNNSFYRLPDSIDCPRPLPSITGATPLRQILSSP